MTDLLLAPSGAPNGEIVIAGFIQRLADAPYGELEDAGPAPARQVEMKPARRVTESREHPTFIP